MARAGNFKRNTILVLAQRVGYLCSNPDCRTLTAGAHQDPSKSIIVGAASHICGATPGGPRYNPNITDGERSDISNGIWLCANDHLLIDSDPDKYSVEFLKEWKVKAERHQTSPISIKKLKVFLCHASEDKPAARALFKKLQKDNCDPWLDTEKLIPGSEWKLEISRAVRDSDVVIVCLSEKSITKKGYIQKEIRVVLDEADEQPPGDIYVIPLRLENCEVPERFRDWHWVNFYEDGGYDNLIRALRIKADSLGLDIPRVEGQGVSEKQEC